jgi:hypothetical protein
LEKSRESSYQSKDVRWGNVKMLRGVKMCVTWIALAAVRTRQSPSAWTLQFVHSRYRQLNPVHSSTCSHVSLLEACARLWPLTRRICLNFWKKQRVVWHTYTVDACAHTFSLRRKPTWCPSAGALLIRLSLKWVTAKCGDVITWLLAWLYGV